MSSIDERVVELLFDNGQFESGVQHSVGTLEKLKRSLNLENSARGLEGLQRAGKNFSLSNVASNIQTVTDRFSALGIIGDQVLRRLTDSALNFGINLLTAIPAQIVSGGKARAQNIEQAQFQLKGLLKEKYDWDKIYEDLDYAVSGTAYGIDAAAKAAAQLSASNIAFGEDMKSALRGISGVAGMTNSSYEDIAHIFTTIAGQGKLMTDQLNQFAGRGLNVAATLAEKMNVTEAQLREMVTKGKIDFKTFSEAMNDAFGEQATKANETFNGALSNVKASLSRMGQQFATPAYDNLRKVFVALIPVLKDVEKLIKPISERFTQLAESASGAVVSILDSIHATLSGEDVEGGSIFDVFSGTAVEKAKNSIENFDKIVAEHTKSIEEAFGQQGIAGIAINMFSNALNGKTVSKELDEVANVGDIYEKIVKAKKEYTPKNEEEKKQLTELEKAYAEVAPYVEQYKKLISDIKDNSKNTGEQVDPNLSEKMGTVVGALKERIPIFSRLLGLEQEENETVSDATDEYKNLEEIVQDAILGKFGNGEERKEALEALGVSYAVIQNKINELLGVQKRYEVSAEDEAKMTRYFGKVVSESGESSTKANYKLNNLRNTLSGIGAAIQIVTNFASALYNNIIKPFMAWAIPKVLDTILNITGNLGKKLKSLNEDLSSKDFFNVKFKAIADGFRTVGSTVSEFFGRVGELEGVKKLKESLEKLKNVLGEFIGVLFGKFKKGADELGENIQLPKMDFFLDIVDKVAAKLSEFINFLIENKGSISGFFKPLTSVGGSILSGLFGALSSFGGAAKEGAGGILDFLTQIGGALGGGIIKGLKELGAGLDRAFGGVTLQNIMRLIGTGGLAAFGVNLGIFSKQLGEVGTSLRDGGIVKGLSTAFGGTINNIFSSLSTTLKKFQASVKAKALKDTAIAIGLLTASLVVLSALDPDKATTGIMLIGAMLFELVKALQAMSAITIPTPDGIFESLMAGNQFTRMGRSLLLMAGAVLILSVALKKLSKLSWEEIAKGLTGVVGLMAACVASLKMMSQFSSANGLVSAGFSMIFIAIAMNKLAKAMTALSKLSWEEIAKGLTGVVGAMFAIVAGMKQMPTDEMLGAGAAVLIVSVALKNLVSVVKSFGDMSWEDMVRGLLGVAGAMIFVAGVISLMPEKGMIGAGTGILIVSFALKNLATVIEKISGLTWEELARGLTGIAGAMVAIVFAFTLMPTAGILAASAAMLVMSLSMRILAGTLALLGNLSWEQLAIGLTALAGGFIAIAFGATILKPLVTTLLLLSAAFLVFGVGLAAVGVGVSALVIAIDLLASSAGLLAVGLVQVLQTISTSIIDSATLITEALKALLVSLVTAITDSIPLIATAVVNMLVSLLMTVHENIGTIGNLAFDIIIDLMSLLSQRLPQIVDQAVKMVVTLINGIANAIRANTDTILGAIGNVLGAILEFILTALANIVGMIPGIGSWLKKQILGIRDQVKEEFGEEEGQEDSGGYSEGVATGLEGVADKESRVLSAYNKLKETIGKVFGNGYTEGKEAVTNLQKGIHDGIEELFAEGSFTTTINTLLGIDPNDPEYGVQLGKVPVYIESLDLPAGEKQTLYSKFFKRLKDAYNNQTTLSLNDVQTTINKLKDVPEEKRKSLLENFRTVLTSNITDEEKTIALGEIFATIDDWNVQGYIDGNETNSLKSKIQTAVDNAEDAKTASLAFVDVVIEEYEARGINANGLREKIHSLVGITDQGVFNDQISDILFTARQAGWDDASLELIYESALALGDQVVETLTDRVRKGYQNMYEVVAAGAAGTSPLQIGSILETSFMMSGGDFDKVIQSIEDHLVYGEWNANDIVDSFLDSMDPVKREDLVSRLFPDGIENVLVTDEDGAHLSESFVNAFKQEVEGAFETVDPSSGNAGALNRTGEEMATTVAGGFSKEAPKAFEEALKESISSHTFTAGVTTAMNEAGLEAGKNGLFTDGANAITESVGEAITSNMEPVEEAASEIVEDVVETIESKAEEAIQGNIGEGSSLADGILGILGINDSTKEEGETKADEIGDGVISGFVNSLINGEGDLKGAIDEAFGDNVLGYGSSLLGVNSPSWKFALIGFYVVKGFVNGITKSIPLAKAAVMKLATDSIEAMRGKLPEFETLGVQAAIKYVSGINSQGDSVKSAGTKMANKAIAGAAEINNSETGIYLTGRYFSEGYIKGILSKVDEARKAGGKLANAAESGNRDASKTQSPSRVAMELGNYFGMGYIIGINEFGSKVYSAAHDMGEMAVEALRTPLGIVSDILGSDMDMDPTIRPVMDLSDIQNGVRSINAMTPAMSVGIGTISSQMNRRKVDSNEEVISAINALREGMNTPSNVYNVNGITYDDGSNISDAVRGLIRAARVERRR